MRITKRLIENSAACALLLVTVITLFFSVTNTLSVWNGWFKDNEISFILIVLSLLGLTSTLPQVLDILTKWSIRQVHARFLEGCGHTLWARYGRNNADLIGKWAVRNVHLTCRMDH